MTCRRELIGLFLNDSLSDVEQAAFEEHLATCADCREELSASAAEPELWSEAAEALSDDAIECGVSAPLWIEPTDEDDDAERNPARRQNSERAGTPHAKVQVPAVQAVLNLLAPTDDPHKLGRLSGYEIAGVIGCGGMGVVLKGFDASLNRFVAIKVLAAHLASSGAARRRFAREAQAAAAVVHDNVVAIHGVAEANGMPYLVMPYIRGESLQKRLDKRGPFGVAEILRVGMQVASGLAAAHAQGLVHRDIKPANILLEDGVERLRITDFGLARAADDASLTHSGVIAGTPQYMSPEQARGEVIDGRSDLFSLGSVLYALCTGRPPFRAETAYGVLHRLWNNTPRPIRDVNPDIPDWLAGIVMTLLKKTPGERFESADAVARLMEQCLAHVQQPDQVRLPEVVRLAVASLEPIESVARPEPSKDVAEAPTTPTTPPRSWRAWTTRRKVTAALSGLVVVALLISLMVFQRGPRESPGTPNRDAAKPSASASTTDERWHDSVASDLESVQSQLKQLNSDATTVEGALPLDDLEVPSPEQGKRGDRASDDDSQ